MRQLFDTAAKASPAPTAPATTWAPGTTKDTATEPEDDRPGDQADLTLELPALRAAADLAPGLLPGDDAAVQDRQAGHADPGQGLLGLGGAGAGAAEEDDVVVQVGGQLLAVLAQGVQGHVVGPGDVHRLELGGRADVQDAHPPCGDALLQARDVGRPGSGAGAVAGAGAGGRGGGRAGAGGVAHRVVSCVMGVWMSRPASAAWSKLSSMATTSRPARSRTPAAMEAR